MVTTVNIHEAKTHLSKLIAKVIAGEEVIIAKADQPVVKITAIREPETARTPGNDQGKVRIADNFDDPLEEFETT